MGDKTIPEPLFAGDDGSSDPALCAALAEGDVTAIVARLLTSRLLVPAVAVTADGGRTAGAPSSVRGTDIALVLIKLSDGRTALPAFTSLASLTVWDSAARPVPAAAPAVAAHALGEGADLVVLDPAGPAPVPLVGPALWAVAEARPLLPPSADPAVLGAIRAAVAAEADSVDAHLADGDDRTDLRLHLTARGPADARPVAGRIADRLAKDEIMRARVGRGVEIVLVDHEACRPGVGLLS